MLEEQVREALAAAVDTATLDGSETGTRAVRLDPDLASTLRALHADPRTGPQLEQEALARQRALFDAMAATVDTPPDWTRLLAITSICERLRHHHVVWHETKPAGAPI